MCKFLRAGILITFGVFILCIIGGCGDDSPEVVTDPSDPTTSETPRPRTIDAPPPHTGPPVLVDPAAGAEIPSNTEFSLTFEQAVVAVTVNGFPATGADRNWTASPTLLQGDSQVLNVGWTNQDGSTGSHVVGPYTVRIPDTTPPRITSGTIADGTVDVDPAPINAGGFRFDFHEAVTGSIKLTNEAGADLNWIANVWGQTAILTPVAGQELANETTYKIEINVQDGAGNQLQRTITFVTKPK